MKLAEWHLSGQPGLNGWEEAGARSDGFLSWSYSTGVDTRYPGTTQLAPLLTTVDLSGQQDNATNVRAFAFTEGVTSDDGERVAIACGRRVVTILLSTRAVSSTVSASAFSSAVTDLETTRSAGGTQELSACLESNIYQVITAVNVGTTTYTTSANNESIINRFLLKGQSFEADGLVYGLGQASSIENVIRHNVLTGSTTMDASAWVQRSLLSAFNITFTGGALDGPFVIIGTNFGPFRYNNDFFTWEPMLPELANSPSTNNCKGMKTWSKLGVVCPLEDETRLIVGLDSVSAGPERFHTNNSPVFGRVTAQGYANRTGFWAIYNPIDDRTYLCFVRPRQPFEVHGNPVSIYPITRLAAGVECEAIEYAGTKGSQPNPTWYIGNDTNAAWFIEPRHGYGPADTNQTFQASGTIFLTELMRAPDKDKSPKWVALRTDGCSANETITVTLTYTDKLGQSGTEQRAELAVIKEDGFHMLEVPENKQFWAESFGVEIAFARGGTTTNTPRIIRYGRSDFRVFYEERNVRDRMGRELPQ